ncbi:hypothetical protein FKP32DRAFT_924064 [Trametes sanguinea]|nr:hypothetical protein FKP32DRAFT_924064 [Trametes sanguinea]
MTWHVLLLPCGVARADASLFNFLLDGADRLTPDHPNVRVRCMRAELENKRTKRARAKAGGVAVPRGSGRDTGRLCQEREGDFKEAGKRPTEGLSEGSHRRVDHPVESAGDLDEPLSLSSLPYT